MVEIAFDVSGTEPLQAGGGKPAPPGVYDAELHEIKHRTNRGDGKDDDLECIYRILKDNGEVDGQYNRLWDYVGLTHDQTEWKRAQFFEALGLADEKNRKGKFNPKDHCIKFTNGDGDTIETGRTRGTRVKIRVKSDTYKGEPTSKISAVLPIPKDEEEDDPFE